MKKTAVFIIVFILLSGFTVSAREPDSGYSENYEDFIGDKIDGILDNDTKEKLSESGIVPEDSGWINNITVPDVFSYVLSLLRGNIKKPFSSFFLILSTLLILSAMSAFGTEKSGASASAAATAVTALIIAADIFSCVSAAESGIKLCAEFMIGFIPIFAALIAASGRTLTAVSSSSVLLFAANAVSYFSAFGVLPMMGGYLSVSIAGGVSPLVSKLDLAGTVKKITLWALSLVSTVFLGVLSVQTAVNSSADSVTIKTAKYILGTSVPVAGNVLSEAASAVSSSVSFLKNSVGIYAVIVLAVIMIPVITDILLWRACFSLGAVIGEFFGEEKIPALLKAVDSVLACLLGIILLVTALFIISLTVLVAAGSGI